MAFDVFCFLFAITAEGFLDFFQCTSLGFWYAGLDEKHGSETAANEKHKGHEEAKLIKQDGKGQANAKIGNPKAEYTDAHTQAAHVNGENFSKQQPENWSDTALHESEKSNRQR